MRIGFKLHYLWIYIYTDYHGVMKGANMRNGVGAVCFGLVFQSEESPSRFSRLS